MEEEGSSPPPPASSRRQVAARSSWLDSLKGCGLASGGVRINKEQLKRRISIPEYLRTAMAEAVQTKNPVAVAKEAFKRSGVAEGEEQDVPHAPLVVFVNSNSGGRHGEVLKLRLQELMGPEQVSLSCQYMILVDTYRI